MKSIRFSLIFLAGLAIAIGKSAGQTLLEPNRAKIEEQCPFGLPSDGQVLFREGYILSHNNWLKIPNWVAYKLDTARLKQMRRSDDFRPDLELRPWQRAELSDYRGFPYDRGHLAPAADMKISTRALSESFFLSNMAPQVGPGFNRGIWKDLETLVRDWASPRGELWIITGPVFMDSNGDGIMEFKLIGKDHVAVPTHFFKIVIDKKPDGSLDTLAFVLPNEKVEGGDISEYISSIDDIERLTGLDFLAVLPDDIEEALESRVTDRVWGNR